MMAWRDNSGVYRSERLPEQGKLGPDSAAEIAAFVLQREKAALAGEAYVPARGPTVRKRRVKKSGRLPAPIRAILRIAVCRSFHRQPAGLKLQGNPVERSRV